MRQLDESVFRERKTVNRRILSINMGRFREGAPEAI